MTIIDCKDNIVYSLALPLRRVAVFTGSALPLVIVGIPDEFVGREVTGVAITLTNADGTTVSAPCERCDNGWTILFAPSFFTAYGFISRGVKVVATVMDGSTTRSVTVGVGDLDVVADAADVRRGDPDKSVQGKGDDIFMKSEFIEGVQHYKRISIVNNPRIGWGFSDPEGDYILVDGEFQEVN